MAAKRNGHFEIHKAKRGATWSFVASNGKRTANNEVFATPGNAKRAVRAHVQAIVGLFMRRPRIEWTETKREDGVLVLTCRAGFNVEAGP